MFVKNITKSLVQYFTFHGKENCYKGMFKLVKRCDKCLKANGDSVEK